MNATEATETERLAAIAARVRRFAERHPERFRYQTLAARMNKRAKAWGAEGRVSGSDLAAIDGQCRYCGGIAGGFDHVIALADGGANLVANLVPACLSCNRRKASDTKRRQIREWNASRAKYGRRACGHAYTKGNRLKCPYCDDVVEPHQEWRRRKAGLAA